MSSGGIVRVLRAVQFFLSHDMGAPTAVISEVSVDQAGDIFCSCLVFTSRGKCDHSKLVRARIESNNGRYPLEISKRAPKESIEEAETSPTAYRNLIINFGHVEVL